MTSLSIKWRISLWISAVLIAVIAIICIVAYNEFEESHLRNLDQTILAISDGISASLDNISNKEKWTEEINRLTAGLGGKSFFYYRIWIDGSDTDLLPDQSSESRQGQWLQNLPEKNKPEIEKTSFVNIGTSGDEYRAAWTRHKVGDEIVNIAVAGSSHFTYHEMHEFVRLLLILGASLIISSVIAAFWTVHTCLRPIDITAKRLQDIKYPKIREVIFDNSKAPRELKPFIEALNDMLGRLNKVLQQQKQFTSDAAHELRTPLSLAKSTLQSAQMLQGKAEQYKSTINDTLEDVERMERIIQQMLILARLDEIGVSDTDGEVRIDILLRELTETYSKKLELFGGKIILEDISDTTVQGNIDELIRLFSNILDNAVKYGPEGGTIRISRQPESDGHITINIHDDGGTIPSESIPHLFDRFYRVDPSRSKNTGGAGLGLAIAREIAIRHKGDISISSTPQSGTLVSIKLAQN